MYGQLCNRFLDQVVLSFCSYCALQTSRKADFNRPYQKPVNLAFINHNNLCVEPLERVLSLEHAHWAMNGPIFFSKCVCSERKTGTCSFGGVF